METGFLDSLLAKPPVLLGRQLREFSIGHALTLQAIEHPLVCGRELDRYTVLTAICICELTFAECRTLLADWETNMDALAKVMPDFKVGDVAPLLIDYYTRSTDFPEIMVDELSRGPRYPLELSLIVGLMQIGMTETEALDAGYCRAVWYCAAANGKEIIPTQTRRMFENLEALEAAARAEWIADQSEGARLTRMAGVN